jgi:SAM-dependent methyltransferase
MGHATNGPLSLVVPVFNEAKRFDAALEPLVTFAASRGTGSELIFVDDGSTDDTARLLDAVETVSGEGDDSPVAVRVLRRTHEGKGAAVQAGILAARCPLVAFCDIDLATPLAELGRIVDVAEQGVLAVGSRGLPTSQLGTREHRSRELLGKSFNRVAQLLVTPGIADTQCGAKAAPRSLWSEILAGVTEPGFAWDVDVIAQALAAGKPVVEVPIVWNHQPGSALHVARDGARMLAALPAIRRRARLRSRVRPDAPAPSGVHSLEQSEGVFDDENAALLAAADAQHWWFRSRATYVNWALGRFANRSGWLVDLGAGAGGVTARLAWDRRRVVAVEGNAELAACARDTHRILNVQGDAAHPPVRAEAAAVVCLLDVIEHVHEPLALLRAARELLAAGGVCVVTVPGHERLWSRADEVLGHQRRYNRATLRAQLETAGFHVEYVGHVFSWLVPPVWFRRRVTRPSSPELGLDVHGGLTDAAALVLTACERTVLRFVSLPAGTSVLAVGRRTASEMNTSATAL